jgi:hypothetical protein
MAGTLGSSQEEKKQRKGESTGERRGRRLGLLILAEGQRRRR